MFSRAEMQQLKRDFWIEFANRYPRKWLLYDTKIKDFALKFDISNNAAFVMIEVSNRDDEKRRLYFEKLLSLQSVIHEELPYARFDSDFTLENGKAVSRVYVMLDEVKIGNRQSWNRIFDFFHDKMAVFELLFYEFEDYIKDISS